MDKKRRSQNLVDEEDFDDPQLELALAAIQSPHVELGDKENLRAHEDQISPSPLMWDDGIGDEELCKVTEGRSSSPSDWIDDEVTDEELCRIMQSDAGQANEISVLGCVVDPKLELLDPTPNIWNLFRIFDQRFFDNNLSKRGVWLHWAPRMTRTAGLTAWSPQTGSCEIRISKPLHKLRPRSDLVETLIHEMIHALLFVTHEDDNHESHGQVFHSNMYRINREGGCKISVFHNFHEEVRYYQKHVWRCTGPCREQPPYFGYLRRAVNRAPSKSDFWYYDHQVSCGGTYVKVSEPETKSKDANTSPTKKGGPSTPSKKSPVKGVKDIRTYFPPSPKETPSATYTPTAASSSSKISASSNPATSSSGSFIPFSGQGKKLGGRTEVEVEQSLQPNKITEDEVIVLD